MSEILIAWVIVPALTALAVIVLFLGIYLLVEQSEDYRSRLVAWAGGPKPEADGARPRAKGLSSLFRRLNRFLSGQGTTDQLALRLVQADAHLTVPEFLFIDLVVGIILGVLGFALRGHLLSALAGGLIGLALPWLFLERRRSRRRRAFQEQLLDVLALVVGSLRGGHGLTAALDLVSKELSPPASEEFGRVAREVGLGLSQAEALDNLVGRVGSEDMQLIITAMNISQQVGGDLSQVLEKISTTIRERMAVLDEIRVLTTQQRLTTYLLVSLPFALGLILAIINPSWMMRLFEPGWVRLVPAVALFLEIVGYVLTRRLTRIDV